VTFVDICVACSICTRIDLILPTFQAAADYIGKRVVPDCANEIYEELSMLLQYILVGCSVYLVSVVYPTGWHIAQTIWLPVQIVCVMHTTFKVLALVVGDFMMLCACSSIHTLILIIAISYLRYRPMLTKR
jgi:hypothetical protein